MYCHQEVQEHLHIGKTSGVEQFYRNKYASICHDIRASNSNADIDCIIVPLKSKQTALNLSIVPACPYIVIYFTKIY
jgi:hypothetical protein